MSIAGGRGNGPLFVWRLGGSELVSGQYGDCSPCRRTDWDCGYCGNPLHHYLHVSDFGIGSSYWLCHLCGFAELERAQGRDERPSSSSWSELRSFQLDEPRLALGEIGAYLRKNFVDIRDLPPRRLEELIADAFREQGLELELTRATRDGGYDLLLFGDGSQVTSLVEIKHWRGSVGVEEVRKLRAVQLRDDIGEALLITSSRFTRDAQHEAAASHPVSLGYRMTLLDAHDLLAILDVYRDRTDVLPTVTAADKTLMSRGCADTPQLRSRHTGLRSTPAGTELLIGGRTGKVIGHSLSGRLARLQWVEGGVSYLREPIIDALVASSADASGS